MEIGFIGSGDVAISIARYALAAGHTVILSNTRLEDTLAPTLAKLGDGARSASPQEAVRAEIVVLAVPWTKVPAALSSLPPWTGQILIDATNPFLQTTPTPILEDLGTQSSSEIVAAMASGARLVKAFNSIPMKQFRSGPRVEGAKRVLFLAGEDADAKAAVRGLIESFGFATLDLGALREGRMQQAGAPLGGVELLLPVQA